MARARQAAHNAPAVVTPQGRLTLTTGTPVMTAEAASQTTIYYTPYVGDRVPLYNGTEWENKVFSELSIAMAASANWATASNFDLFVYNDAGTLRLVTGAAWTNDTTRAEALVRTNGIWLNNASFTGRYGAASTVSIAASRATYVGTMRTSAAGTTTWELGGSALTGDPGLLYLWNCYNRVVVGVVVSDSTDTWTWNTTSYHAANASTGNRVSYVCGLAEDAIDVTNESGGNNSSSTTWAVAVGIDSTTALSGSSGSSTSSATVPNWAKYVGVPGIGYHFVQAIEQGGSAGTTTIIGDAGVTWIKTGMSFTGRF